MIKAEAVKKGIVRRAKPFVGKILGDQELYDAGEVKERQSRQEINERNDSKPFGKLDQ